MRMQEAPQPRHQPFRNQSGRRRDHEHVAVARTRELADRVADALEAGVNTWIDQPPGVGQFDRTGAAEKQLKPELFLERANLVAERSRRYVQLIGGARETQMPRDRL